MRFAVESIDNGFILQFDNDEFGLSHTLYRKDLEAVWDAVRKFSGLDEKEDEDGGSL